jgi:Tol biopolymer transport system component
MLKQRIILFLAAIFIFNTIQAQFGRNKPIYREFDFKVMETPHFDIHYYLENDSLLDKLGQHSELWYRMHQAVLQDTFHHQNPLILYNNHADFQQTNTISGSIGIGTGGVTEAFKNRVVMPLTLTNQQTNHVLGHELVHAFQYNMIINGDSTSLRSLMNLPLWMVEGLAEYLSIGRHDAFTAMWMRDAILNDKLPELKDLYKPKYFPYRYGQAFWAFLTGFYGDEIIKPFFMNTGMYGLEITVDSLLGINLETLSGQWISGLETYYEPYLKDRKERDYGKKLLSEDNSGRINVSPSLSPNGRYVIFLSEKDLFSTDLFLADARTGKIKKKIASSFKDGHIDNLNFLESSGTWSPNSKEFAFVAFNKGRNTLIVKNAESGKTTYNIKIPELYAFSNPAWAPNGKEIIISGLKEGQTDLYSYNLKSKRLKQLTNNHYSEIQANFSADGKYLTYCTDQKSFEEGRTHGKYTFDIAILNLETGKEEILPLFFGADNLNPSYDHEGNILFLSDRDGYRNLYKYISDTGELLQMTELLTGISGITKYSPAIGVSTKRDRILYTHYFDGNYTVYRADSEDFLNKSVDPDSLDFGAGTLPVVGVQKRDIVNVNIDRIDNLNLEDPNNFYDKDYKSKFQLDYIGGGTGVAVGNNLFGNTVQAGGAVDLLFSDMLGNNQLYSSISINGEIYDFGAAVSWLNRKHKIHYGVGLSHFPQVLGWYENAFLDNLEINGQNYQVINSPLNIVRIFEDNLSGFFHYPLSPNFRFEGGLGVGGRFFRWDRREQYYDPVTFQYIGEDREKIDTPDTLNFNNLYRVIRGISYSFNFGIVGDNTIFGLTSPLNGYRYRLGFAKHFGTDDYYSVTADYRKYMWLKPFSIAFRGMGILRFEDQGDVSTNPFFLGNMGIIHGFDFFFNSPYNSNNNAPGRPVFKLDQLYGNKLLVSNFEVRLPFTGPKQIAVIGTNAFFSDLAFFVDAGVAFDEFSDLDNTDISPVFVRTGVGLRINLFGAMILEPYYSWPLKGGGAKGFGLNIVPGW